MNRKQQKKLFAVLCFMILISTGIGLVLYALKQNINLFYTPTELLQTKMISNENVRIGGYVKKNSVYYDKSGESVNFIVTDRMNEITVNYHGVLPSLFREGQTVVVTGKLNAAHQLQAEQVLAKHDERYLPKALKHLKTGATDVT